MFRFGRSLKTEQGLNTGGSVGWLYMRVLFGGLAKVPAEPPLLPLSGPWAEAGNCLRGRLRRSQGFRQCGGMHVGAASEIALRIYVKPRRMDHFHNFEKK